MSSNFVKPPYLGELSNRLSTHNGHSIAAKSALHPHHNNHQPFRNTRLDLTENQENEDDDDLDDPQLQTLAKRFSYNRNSFLYKAASLSRSANSAHRPSEVEGEMLQRQENLDADSREEIEQKTAPPAPGPKRSSETGSGLLSPTSKPLMPLPRPDLELLDTNLDDCGNNPESKPPPPPPKPKLVGADGKVKPPVPVKPTRGSLKSEVLVHSNAEEPYLEPIKLAAPDTTFNQEHDMNNDVKLRPKRTPTQSSGAGHSGAAATASVTFSGIHNNPEDEILDASRPVSIASNRNTRTISREIPLPVLPVRTESMKSKGKDKQKNPNRLVRFFNTFKSIFLPKSKSKSKSRKSLPQTSV